MVRAMALDIGNGLAVDEWTLKTVVLDAEAVKRELVDSDNPADRVVAALAMNDVRLAAAELASITDEGFWTSALTAELARAECRYAEAISIYRRLLDDPQLTGTRRATAMQHMGKTLWWSGEPQEALDILIRARDLRRKLGSPADLIRSSEMAVDRVASALSDRDVQQ